MHGGYYRTTYSFVQYTTVSLNFYEKVHPLQSIIRVGQFNRWCHMQRTRLVLHHTSQELLQLYRTCKDAQIARRWHIIWLLSINTPIHKVILETGASRTWIWQMCKRYNTHGRVGIDQSRDRKPGAQSLLTPQQYQMLCHSIAHPPPEGGRWTSQKVANWIKSVTGRTHVSVRTGWIYLCRCRAQLAAE